MIPFPAWLAAPLHNLSAKGFGTVSAGTVPHGGVGDDGGMERTDLLIGFLAFGAAVMTLGFWLWSSLATMD